MKEVLGCKPYLKTPQRNRVFKWLLLLNVCNRQLFAMSYSGRCLVTSAVVAEAWRVVRDTNGLTEYGQNATVPLLAPCICPLCKNEVGKEKRRLGNFKI